MKIKILYTYLFCFLFVLFLAGIIFTFQKSDPENIRPRELDTAITEKIKIGDLVLREGTSVQSQIISQLSDSKFTHIGIITSVEDVILVTHASNDEETNEAVSETTLDEFISFDLAYSVRIIRLKNIPVNVREKIALNAKQKIGQKFYLVSDSMSNSDKRMYCTTLIYDAIRQELPEFTLKWKTINMPAINGAFLMPSAFLETDNELIYSSEQK